MSRVNIMPSGLRRSARKGFTLIELMVVVAVMAILSSAIVPSIVAAVRRTGAKTAATKAFDLLNFAYAAAIARRQPVTVNFDADRHICWVSVSGTSLPWLSEGERSWARTLASVELPESIEISFYRGTETPHELRSGQQWETIRFEPDGTVEDVVVEMADRSGDTYTLEVVAATGEILLKEEE